jgi:hypothetical protein
MQAGARCETVRQKLPGADVPIILARGEFGDPQDTNRARPRVNRSWPCAICLGRASDCFGARVTPRPQRLILEQAPELVVPCDSLEISHRRISGLDPVQGHARNARSLTG